MVRARLQAGIAATMGALLSVSLLTPATAAGPTPSFAPSVSSPAGDQPTSLAAADLDGDGQTDLAVTTGSGEVGILPGLGTGFFPSRFPFAVGGSPTSVLAAPLRTGGPPDLAVTTGNMVVVLFNSGTASFVPGPVLPVGTSPSSVVTADLDDDGDLDLLTSNVGSGDVSVLLGDGTGGFTSGGTFAVGAAPSGLDVGDLDGDGHLDVVVSNGGAADVSVLLGNGDGTFLTPGRTFATGSQPSSVLLADFDDDGQPDALVTDAGSDDVALLLGDGAGGFGLARTAPVSTPVGPGQQPVAAAADDLNGDGHRDVAVLNAASNTIGVLLGDGGGNLDPTTTIGSGPSPTWLVTADLDGDERPDLALSSAGADSAATRLNSTPFPLSAPLPQPPASVGCGHRAVLVGGLAATAYRTAWFFEYRQPGRGTRRTPERQVEPDDDPVTVVARVGHLRPGVRLSYRLVVISAGRRVAGPWETIPIPRRCPP